MLMECSDTLSLVWLRNFQLNEIPSHTAHRIILTLDSSSVCVCRQQWWNVWLAASLTAGRVRLSARSSEL